jgi:Tol biopolymer transport system component
MKLRNASRPASAVILMLLLEVATNADAIAQEPGAVRLTQSPEYDAGPTWSPDGAVIAFVSFRSGGDGIRACLDQGQPGRFHS